MKENTIGFFVLTCGLLLIAGNAAGLTEEQKGSAYVFSNDLNSTVCGIKFNDLNNNGIQDAGEPGLSNWTILIQYPNGTNATTAATNVTGGYCSSLNDGDYIISEEMQPGWTQTYPYYKEIYTVNLTAGQALQNISFGNRRTNIPIIIDSIYLNYDPAAFELPFAAIGFNDICNCTEFIPGIFSYPIPDGTILGAGVYSMNVSFVPEDQTNYTNASANVTINVNKATPAITWYNPAYITYGTALSETQNDAISDVPGTFAYNPPDGAIPEEGYGQELLVNFTPDDQTNYTNASANVTIDVLAQTNNVVNNINKSAVYTSIQKAINDASPGDEIQVESGIYYENINVDRQLKLRGIGNPVVGTRGDGSAITLMADGITLEGFTTSPNNFVGIFLYSSSNNTIRDNNASSNENGILLFDSGNNTITGNNASFNNLYGISLYDSGNNAIYNNIFNNSINFYSSGSNINTWNTTMQEGTSIIGGPYLGGNYWADPGGPEFSQTCTDGNGSGICNSSFALDPENVDYLPLTKQGNDPKIFPVLICGNKFNDLDGDGVRDIPMETLLPNWIFKITYFDGNINSNVIKQVVTNSTGRFCINISNNYIKRWYYVSEVQQSGWNLTSTPAIQSLWLQQGDSGNVSFGNKQCCTPPPSGMVGWWPMDEPNGFFQSNDFAGAVNNYGSPRPLGYLGYPGFFSLYQWGPKPVTGKVNAAQFFFYDFYFNSMPHDLLYLNVSDDSELNFGYGDFSIDAWVNVSRPTNASNYNYQPIVDKKLSNGNGYSLYIISSSPAYARLKFDIKTPANPVTLSLFSLPIITYNNWTHVAVNVSRNSRMNLFINGNIVAFATAPTTSGSVNNNLPLFIGKSRLGGNDLLTAIKIDELEIFNRSINQTEIMKIFNASSAGKCKTKAAICGAKFNDSNGNGIRDAGEPGLPGWNITVRDLYGNLIGSNVTDSLGRYCVIVPIVPLGNAIPYYKVTEEPQSGWIQTFPSASYNFPLTGGQTKQNVNFGNKNFSNNSCCKPPSGMVGWWPLDEQNGAMSLIDINSGNSATPFLSPVGSGQAPQPIPGVVNGAINFVKFGNASGLSGARVNPGGALANVGSGDFTIDAWVKFPPAAANRRHYIVNKFNTQQNKGYALYIMSPGITGNERIDFTWGDGTYNGNVQSISPIITTNQWHHVTVTFARNVNSYPLYIRLYVDGVQKGLQAGGYPIGSLVNSNFLEIGREPSSIDEAIAIDELEIFNRALNITEINNIVNASKAGKCKVNTICGVKFNDSNGNGIKDANETGIANFSIVFKNSNGTVAGNISTDVNGSYCITLPAGNYTISELQQSGWIQTSPSAPGNYTVNLTAGQTIMNISFGNKRSCCNPPSGMVSWWPGNGNTYDIQAMNHGTFIGGASYSSGKVGQAFNLNGATQYVRVANDPSLNFGISTLSGANFSIDAWIKADNSSNQTIMPIVNKYKSSGVGGGTPGYSLYLYSGRLSLTLADPVSPPGHYIQNGVADLRDGTFHFVAVTVNRTHPLGITFYVDGIQYGIQRNPLSEPGNLFNSEPLLIGAEIMGSSFFKGLIDEVEIFNRALNQTDIQAIYNASSTGKCKSCNITSINLNTGFNQNSNSLISLNSGDDDWKVVVDPVNPAVPRPAIVSPISSFGQSTWVAPLPGSRWISINTSRGWHDQYKNKNVTYRFNFTLPRCFTNVSMNLSIIGDNKAWVFLNGNFVGLTANYPAYLPPIIASTGFTVGMNSLSVVVYDFGAITGLDMVGNVSYCNCTKKINGTAIDPYTLDPLPAVKVYTDPDNWVVTDEFGIYSIDVPPGIYQINAKLDPKYYVNDKITISTMENDVVVADIEMVKKPVGTVAGAVLSRLGGDALP